MRKAARSSDTMDLEPVSSAIGPFADAQKGLRRLVLDPFSIGVSTRCRPASGCRPCRRREKATASTTTDSTLVLYVAGCTGEHCYGPARLATLLLMPSRAACASAAMEEAQTSRRTRLRRIGIAKSHRQIEARPFGGPAFQGARLCGMSKPGVCGKGGLDEWLGEPLADSARCSWTLATPIDQRL